MSSDGAGDVSVDRRIVLRSAGQANWLDDGIIVCNALIDGLWRVVAIPSGGGIRLVLDNRGAAPIVAGGGRWLGWLNGVGMFGSLGSLPQAYPLGAGRDGTLAWLRDYSTRLGFVLTAPDGSETEVADALVRDIQVLGPGQAIWQDFAWPMIDAIGVEVPQPALPAGRMRVADVDGERWLVYWSEGTGLIAQVDGADDGYILERRPIAFNHDAAAIYVINSRYALLTVAWSVTAGEGPNDLVWLIVDTTMPRQRLAPADGGTSPPAPLPDPPRHEPVPSPPDVPHPDHPAPPSPPPSNYFTLSAYEDTMTEQGWLIGPGDKAVSVDTLGRVTFTRTELTEADLLELTKPDDRYSFRHVGTGLFLGADATKHTPTGNVCEQLYALPIRRGNYEMWSVGQWDGSPIVSAVIFYDRQGADNGRAWTSAALTWVKK